MYLKKNELKLKKGEHDSCLFGSFNFKFNILLNKDQALSEFLNEFKYEQIIKSEEQISKWLSEFKTLFRNAIKSLYFDLDSKKLDIFLCLIVDNIFLKHRQLFFLKL
jgi:hypothetical protein